MTADSIARPRRACAARVIDDDPRAPTGLTLAALPKRPDQNWQYLPRHRARTRGHLVAGCVVQDRETACRSGARPGMPAVAGGGWGFAAHPALRGRASRCCGPGARAW